MIRMLARLGVFPIVLTCGLRREGHGTPGVVEDSWGKPPSGTLTLTFYLRELSLRLWASPRPFEVRLAPSVLSPNPQPLFGTLG